MARAFFLGKTYNQSSRKDASRTKSGDSSSHNQSYRVWCNTANKRADLKDSNCYQVHPFDAEKSIKFSKKELKGARSE